MADWRATIGLAGLVAVACTSPSKRPSSPAATPPEDTPSPTDTAQSTDDSGGPAQPDTAAQLQVFYDTYGGRDEFRSEHVLAFESLLYAEDAVARGNLTEAIQQVEAVFSTWPRGDSRWFLASDGGTAGSNTGHPVGYYGNRMVEQIAALDGSEPTGSLTLTAVVAPCARVRRPVYPSGEAEVVNLEVHPLILEDSARRLHLATALFRRWMQAITGGLEVALVVHELSECTTVDYTDNGSVVVSYPDATGMIAAVPDELADNTDLWWVVAPSGVPGTGEDTGRHFITGGMGATGSGLPLFLSDDLWFVRKPEHMGRGDWTEAEVRAYHPQWFQHEFMHHVFATWPELGLEDTDHQWFDLTTWPADFEGVHEADYYAEAITKRLLSVTPSLAAGLTAPEVVDPATLPLSAFEGSYERVPVENEWHQVMMSARGGSLRWTNAAGVSWGLEVRDGGLYTTADCPYGVSEVGVELAEGSSTTVGTLWFSREAYRRTD